MFWKSEISISKELYLNSKPVMYFCRFLGYFPFSIVHTESKILLRWSPYYTLYSFTLGAFLIIGSYWQICKVFVNNPDLPMTSIDLLTIFVGFSGWLLTLFCAIFIMPMRVQKFFVFISCLNKVDSSLKTVYKSSEKYVALLIMVLIFIPAIASLMADCMLETGEVFNFKCNQAVILRTMQTLVIAVTYIIRYMMYGIGKRISRLNYLLELENLKYRKVTGSIPGRIRTDFRLSSGARKRNQSQPFTKDGEVIDTLMKTTSTIHDDIVIIKLMKTYLKLCEAATLLNELLNETMTIAVLGCAIQLLHPMYFLILCMSDSSYAYPFFTEAALMNIIKDLVWEICIIDSCYICSKQVRTTEKLVCRLLSWDTSKKYRLQVKRFGLCLGLSKIEFSAFDFFKIDRLLFTDMLNTYTTVLMLLLQMHYDNVGVSQ